MHRPYRTIAHAVLLAALALVAPTAAQTWVRAGGGLASMAMDDINDADLRFYEETIHGYNFPDVGTGFLLDLAVGHDIGPDLAIGFHWDRQWARVKGTDVDVEGTLGLHANAFVGRVQWRPVRGRSWRLGLCGGAGPLLSDGTAKVARGSVNYGESELAGSTWSWDAALVLDAAVGEASVLAVWAGWRWAKIDDFTYEKRPALKEDGTPMSLDYTGWVVRAGLVYRFDGGDGGAPDMR